MADTYTVAGCDDCIRKRSAEPLCDRMSALIRREAMSRDVRKGDRNVVGGIAGRAIVVHNFHVCERHVAAVADDPVEMNAR